MDAKQAARELVGEAVGALAENEGGGAGSIPGPVIGWLIKKGEIKKPKKKRPERGKRKVRVTKSGIKTYPAYNAAGKRVRVTIPDD